MKTASLVCSSLALGPRGKTLARDNTVVVNETDTGFTPKP